MMIDRHRSTVFMVALAIFFFIASDPPRHGEMLASGFSDEKIKSVVPPRRRLDAVDFNVGLAELKK